MVRYEYTDDPDKELTNGNGNERQYDELVGDKQLLEVEPPIVASSSEVRYRKRVARCVTRLQFIHLNVERWGRGWR